MVSRPNPNSPAAVSASWLAALCGGIVALGFVAGGQGLGAMFGGCRWIGVTLPLDQQAWALVNQPSLAFATQGSATGYWLGGIVACLLAASLLVPLLPRPRGLTWELAVVQLAWTASVLGLGWMALLDPWDGHLGRFLHFHDLPTMAAWLVPMVGAWAALIPTSHLLALARGAQPQLSRAGRIMTVLTHLVLPAGLWVAGGVALVNRTGPSFRGSPVEILGPLEVLWQPVAAALLPCVAAVFMAWVAYPRPWVRPLEPVHLKVTAGLLAATAVLVFLVVVLGAPAGAGKCRGVLWSLPDSRNNIRPWVAPTTILGAASLPGTDRE